MEMSLASHARRVTLTTALLALCASAGAPALGHRAPAGAATNSGKPLTVLFVCPHGAAKSVYVPPR